MQEIILNAETRQLKSRSEAKSLRKAGMIPGIFYHRGEENIPVAANELQIRNLAKSVVTKIINLNLSNNTQHKSILKAVQYDPITDLPVHFDLVGIKEDETIILDIPIKLEGQAAGQRDGGLVQHLLHKIKIECLPKDIPEVVTVNIVALNIGDSIHVKDLSFENVIIRDNADAPIVIVAPPTIEAVAVPAAGVIEEEKKEPEVVVTKGKKEEGKE